MRNATLGVAFVLALGLIGLLPNAPIARGDMGFIENKYGLGILVRLSPVISCGLINVQ
jgi:hypothetical protein